VSSRKVSKFSQLRQWDGSQARAFEELTYQLRDQEPDGVEVIKTGNPDGGVEWYWRHEDGSEWGWQAKFYDDIDDLLSAMRASLVRVADQRKEMRRLTFCIPFDLSDVPDPPRGVMARQKFEDAAERWKTDITDEVEIKLWTAGDLLDRLARAENRGRTWFWFDEAVLDDDFLAKRLQASQEEAGDRYTPPLHIELPIARAIHAAALGESFKGEVARAWRAVSSAAKELAPSESIRTLLLEVERAATSWPIEPGLPDIGTAVASADAG
jgi:hypothetical protein